MSNEMQGECMSDDEYETRDLPAFGQVHPQQRLYALDDEADRERGFLTQNDRQYLTRRNLTGQTERRARMRIRDRVRSAYFDTRYLQYISDEDRRQIFEKARDDFDLHLREAVKEFVRFTHRGLDEFNVDTAELIEHGIRQAESDRAQAAGEVVNVQVDVKIEREEGPDIEELQERFENHDRMARSELAALVNSRYTDIELVDALNHQARQLNSGPQPMEYTAFDMGSGASQYSWEDPDAAETEEILDWLRSFFEEHDIETFEEYDVAYDRLTWIDEEAANALSEKVNRLSRCAPQFEEQLAEEAGLATSDMTLLHDILWNPANIDVEAALEKEVRPRTAGDDWTPAADQELQKFIARVQLAREGNGIFTSGGEEGAQRWDRVLELADFDKDEWSEYMHDQRVSRYKQLLQEENEANADFSLEDLLAADSFEDQQEILYENAVQEDTYWLALSYGEEVFSEVLEALEDEFGLRE